uniref:R13L1/DRL21-like LRR repeat region domain-containing protein n=1 Tax=Leersia perrieri TaxID=77586 RepID=A0A0D9W9N6_9ORYZ
MSLSNYKHLWFLRLEDSFFSEYEDQELYALPRTLSKCYHLQVLDVGSCETPHSIFNGLNDLFSLRHLIAAEEVLSSIASIGKMTSLQKLRNLCVKKSSGFELAQLHSMNELIKLGVSGLENVITQQEACMARLKDKQHLEKLHLSWNNAQCGYTNYENEYVSESNFLHSRSTDSETEEENQPMSDSNGSPSLEHIPDIASELFQTEHLSWLPKLSKLTIHECPHLRVHGTLPPSNVVSKLSIASISTLSTDEQLLGGTLIMKSYDSIVALYAKELSFGNPRFLTRLQIKDCRNMSILFEGFRHLICLNSLEISDCQNVLYSHLPPEHTCNDTVGGNCNALPSLQSLHIVDCGITGKWLSLMLRYVQALQELSFERYYEISVLSLAEEGNSQPNLMSTLESYSSGYTDNTSSAQDETLYIPLYLISSLKKLSIQDCSRLTFYGNKEDFARFTSLQEIIISRCTHLLPSLLQNDGRWLLLLSLIKLRLEYEVLDFSVKTLQLSFAGNPTNLKILELNHRQSLKILNLYSFTALEELTISYCKSLDTLEGFQSLCRLRYFKVLRCPGLRHLPPFLESLSRQGYELCPRLEKLEIDDPSILTTSFCKHLISLQHLVLSDWTSRETDKLTGGLQLLKFLQELQFEYCHNLKHLPTGLHKLPALRRLGIHYCQHIMKLPEKGLPPMLEELSIIDCREDLTDQCRTLTSKLKVKIDGKYVY